MNFFKSKKWTIPALLLLIFLCIGIFIKFAIGTDAFSANVRSIFLGTFSQNPFKKQSEAQLSLIDSKINLNFQIIEEDKPQFAAFIKNWFGTTEEIKNLSFGIDDSLKSKLTQNQPVNLKLTISDKSLAWSSNALPGLQNAFIKSDIEFATGSSKLSSEYSSSSKYQLKIENPADLANYATASGMLTASSKIEGLFKSLPKVATIELFVNGKNISGKIVLK